MNEKRRVVPAKKQGRPGLNKAAADRACDLVTKLLLENYGGNQTALGRALEISQSAVWQIVNKRRISRETAVVAAKLAKVNPQTILGEESGLGTMLGGRFPGLEVCVMENVGRWRDSAVAAARAGLWPFDTAPDEWVKRLEALEAAQASVLASRTPSPPSTRGARS